MPSPSFDKTWDAFFKPEVRRAGRIYFNKKSVQSTTPSETEVQAYIKGAAGVKVILKTTGRQSPLILADCTCPAGKKGRLCKHIWAVLLNSNEEHEDFLEGKSEISKKESNHATTAKKEKSESQKSKEAAYSKKQSAYRKEQYQKQKALLKSKKDSNKKSKLAPDLPADVSSALKYFSENGFDLENEMTSESIGLAKKNLSRVFHPDIGGSHEEILELNEHYEILVKYIR